MANLIFFGVLAILALALAIILTPAFLQLCRLRSVRRQLPQRLTATVAKLDETVLLGPVSAWVAEGEAQAVRDWETKHPTPLPPWEPQLPDCDDCEWVDDSRLGYTARSYLRGYPCATHRLEPPADITGIKMTKIR